MLCTARMREQMKSRSCDTGSFAGRRGMLIPISYLPVTTHFAGMRLELTTRPKFGNEVFNDAPKYLRLSDVAGALKMAGWRLIGWVFYQPRKQFRSCCFAIAAGPVSFHHVPVRQLAFRIAPAGVMIMMSYLTMQMTMTMTMRTAIPGKALVTKCCVAPDEVQLVIGKICLSFAESAVAYHLCEP